MDEVLQLLITDPAGLYVDGTVGGGGHARAILEAIGPRGTLIGLDRDPDAIEGAASRLSTYGERVELVTAPASRLASILTERGIEKVDGVLLDLGLSSDQLASGRGFSFDHAGELDLRFNPQESRPPVHALLARMESGELVAALMRYGEFTRRESRRFATRLLATRDERGLQGVEDLRAALDPVMPPHRRARTLARLFQCLRILANDELHEVERALEVAASQLRSGGILCVISYHSLEDRLVKRFFRPPAPPRRDLPPPPGWQDALFDELTRRPLRPGAGETAANPRARSAKLRAARRK